MYPCPFNVRAHVQSFLYQLLHPWCRGMFSMCRTSTKSHLKSEKNFHLKSEKNFFVFVAELANHDLSVKKYHATLQPQNMKFSVCTIKYKKVLCLLQSSREKITARVHFSTADLSLFS